MAKIENTLLEVKLINIKSFFGDNEIIFRKPINIIVGGNNSGKSNLLNSIYWVFYANEAKQQLKNYGYSIWESKSYLNYYPIFEYKDYLTKNKEKGNIHLEIFSLKKGEQNKSQRETYFRGEIIINDENKPGFEKNIEISPKVDFIDCVLLNPVSFQKFGEILAEKIARLSREIRGTKARGDFGINLTDIVSQNIEGVTDFNFEEKQVEDGFINGFIDIRNCSGGFHKTLILQYLYYLGKLIKIKKFKNSLIVILIDEIENGLHFQRQRDIPQQILNLIKNNPLTNTKIILSTHSPIVYSSFSALSEDNSQLIDVFYIFRDKEGKSSVIRKGEEIDDEPIDRAVEIELGLSIFNLPRITIFVEGNDKYFLEGVLEGAKIKNELKIFSVGGSIPSRMWDLIRDYILSYTRKVILFFDEDKKEEIKKKMNEIKDTKNILRDFYFEPKELEYFIFGNAENKSKENENIRKVIEKISEKCSSEEKKFIEAFKRDIDDKGYDEIKGAKELYSILGKYHKFILEEKQSEIIEKFLEEIKDKK